MKSFLKQISEVARLNHKRGRKSNYIKSLNNANHIKARLKALLRDKYKCKLCPNKIYLEYHHINYSILGKELDEDNLKWTVILCSKCHELVHKDLTHPWNPKNRNKRDIYGDY